MKEKKSLMELKDAVMLEKALTEQQIIQETDRLFAKIKELEQENKDLNSKVKEVYDKEFSSIEI